MAEIPKNYYPVIVIGSGVAGLYSALKLAQYNINKKILLITKAQIKESNSFYAQGGMVAVLNDNRNDTVDYHVKDTIIAGAGLSEPETVRFISENSDSVVKDLLLFGVEFDRDENGNFKLTKEAAHSVCRILHSGGDATGREMEIALCHAVKNTNNIIVFENTVVVDVIKNNDNQYCGLQIFDADNNEKKLVYSDAAIIATGGLGQLYKYTTNPLGATGDGFALAYRAGAELRDMEFVQFHPTALAIDNIKHHNRFLISEAVRGEGAKLCDKNEYEYMKDYDVRGELAPRDIVARANFVQMQKTNSTCVYLNATKLDNVSKRFPTITEKCAQYGIDITKDFIPVAPAAHYFMGGIKTDLNGETSIKNLFAVGEVASTGLHGANRLASNSLLECVVCAYKTAEYISNNIKDNNFNYKELKNEIYINAQNCNLEILRQNLKDTMWQNVGIFRSEDSLNSAMHDLKNIEKEFNTNASYSTKELYEFRNMLITAELIVNCAQNRKESRGAHYRIDYLKTDKIAYHSEIKK